MDDLGTVMRTVYYLVHRLTGERCFRVYESRAAARIAQRRRNARLGFVDRIARVAEGEWELELVAEPDEYATYCIVEGTVEELDLTDQQV